MNNILILVAVLFVPVCCLIGIAIGDYKARQDNQRWQRYWKEQEGKKNPASFIIAEDD